MDPRRFDGMIRRLSGSLSRRSLVGGSLGASVLAAVGLSDDEALAKKQRVRSEACIPTGKRCPSRKPRGKKKKKLGCDKCCQDVVITITNNKGEQVQKCSCKPLDATCAPDKSQQCCSGVCGDNQCQPAPCSSIGDSCATVACCTGLCLDDICRTTVCKELEDPCSENVQCCSELCDVGATFECVACLTSGADCASLADTNCCTGLICQVDGLGFSCQAAP